MAHLTSLQPYTLHPYVFEMNRGRGQRNSIYNINIIYTISLTLLAHFCPASKYENVRM